jgi:hypothetical protein
VGRKPNLSALALVSFAGSFIIARAFTTLSPKTVIATGGIHIHHFWYGLIMLAVGGWLGISYNDERIDRLAAILFGAGGGIIGDEAGLLLTLGDYWTLLTYTVIITFLAIVSITILLIRYSNTIRTEFSHFARSNASLYFGVFLATVSAAILLETDDLVMDAISVVLTAVAFAVILAYFVQRVTRRRRRTEKAHAGKAKA